MAACPLSQPFLVLVALADGTPTARFDRESQRLPPPLIRARGPMKAVRLAVAVANPCAAQLRRELKVRTQPIGPKTVPEDGPPSTT